MTLGFGVSWLVTVIVTWGFIITLRRLAPDLGLVDVPGGRKKHLGTVPLVGGIALFLGFTIGCLTLYQSLSNYRPFFVCVIGLMGLGIADDLHELNALWRIVGQTGVAVIAILWGDIILSNLGNLLFIGPIHLIILGYFLSVLAIVGFINAFNMLDGNDGLCGSLALIQLGFITLLAWLHGLYNELYPLLLLCTAILVFMFFNFPYYRGQASVFMGDAGSMLLGFTVVWYAIGFSQGPKVIAEPVTFAWILAIPLFDCFNVITKRLKQGYSPMRAGREHIHHILLDKGYSSLETVCIIDLLAIILAGVGVILHVLQVPEALSFSMFVGSFIVYFVCFQYIDELVGANKVDQNECP